MISRSSDIATMNPLTQRDLTQLLQAWEKGDDEAIHKIIPLVYDDLHRIAGHYMLRENVNHTLQTTALVNEAYLKLVNQKKVQWQNRGHFFAIASRLMRRILVDHARRHARAKRGGVVHHVPLDETAIVSYDRAEEFIVLDDALTKLAEFDPRKSRVVEMKFFGGLSAQEIAEVEEVSVDTIERDWRKAKAWLVHSIKK